MNFIKRRFAESFLILFSLLFNLEIIYSSKSPVIGKKGMVVTSQKIASEIGMDILKKGGNAVDAAVAVGYALAVVFPSAGNIGGGGFMVIRMNDGTETTMDFREMAPNKAHPNMFLDEKGDVIPNLSTIGYLSAGVPGTVAGLSLALNKYGTMPLKRLIQPAIDLAKKGFPIYQELCNDIINNRDSFLKFPSTSSIFLKGKGFYEIGERFVQKDLANSLLLISRYGENAFYNGKIADLIEKDMKKNGGLITKEDLKNYRAIERTPIIGSYRGYKVISMGLPSSGGIILNEILNILELYDLQKMGHNSSEAIHIITEAERRAFADRAKYLGDMDFTSVPVKELISKEYAKKLSLSIENNKASSSDDINNGIKYPFEGEHTTHYSIVDKFGNAVSCTYTINNWFGSMAVVDGAGFLLNDEMDDFAIKPDYPNLSGLTGGNANSIQPYKRMLSSMTPTIITKDDKLFMVTGSPGGSRIITTVLQIIINVIDYKMSIKEAVDVPRVHHQWKPDTLYYEPYALPNDVIYNLEKMGHKLNKRDYMGDANSILFDSENKIIYGAGDSRTNSVAIGY
jgi:gamma-glutamyltranspeptidase/glutathione hydrolase